MPICDTKASARTQRLQPEPGIMIDNEQFASERQTYKPI